ncbi:hypothetical protein OIU77_005348 [Salix suchowensis]|uniref:Uncharacterized protein n=1 Tax=Salix suchowensis TaxID=1278906 RepID=A0ABQ9AP30_9ROSI|nr:hypothetical protein OIU77_005348 [Salix suchowensis]
MESLVRKKSSITAAQAPPLQNSEEKEQELLEEVNDREEEARPTHQTDLEIATSDTNQLFSRELNLIGNFRSMDSSETSPETRQDSDGEQRVFPCNYCQCKILQLTSTWRTPECP